MKRIVSLVIIGVLYVSMFSVFAPKGYAANSLVGYWKFDEGTGIVAHDSSGNGNDGTLNNGPQWVSGVSGTALSFDGLDNYVNVPDSSSLRISGNGLTVESWIKPAVTLDSSTSRTIILDKGNEYTFDMNDADYQLVPDGKIMFLIVLDGVERHWVETATDHWTADTWYQVVGTYDGSSLKIYVNGILENSTELSGDLFVQSYPLAIGSHTQGDEFYFNGTIDEVKIYNCARTAQEILNDHSGLIGYWKFD